MRTGRVILILLLLLTGVFTTATWLQPRVLNWTKRPSEEGVMQKVFGESRRLFANHFLTKADVTFHRGYYPSLFDQARMAQEGDSPAHAQRNEPLHEHGHEESDGDHHEEGFLRPPRDWIESFGRRFRVTKHTELSGQDTREILPWLRISADLDPHQVGTYMVAAFWLRKHVRKVNEAEEFLREGLRLNPDSYEILYELGRLYNEDRQERARARNLWMLALRRWHEREDRRKDPDFDMLHDITLQLAKLEEEEGNLAKAIEWFQLAKEHSPNPDVLQKHIEELQSGPPVPGSP